MRRLLLFLFSAAVILGTAEVELRLPVERAQPCDCGCGAVPDPIDPGAASTCPCGMPPLRPSPPCGGGASQGVQALAKSLAPQAEAAQVGRRAEPRPCPVELASLDGRSETGDARLLNRLGGMDPPRPCLDPQARLSIFRI